MKDELFQVAMDAVEKLTLRINGESVDYNQSPTWCRIIPNDKKSPMVRIMSPNKHLIYFPEDSTEYHHKAENFSKIAEIESGTILEKISGKIYTKGNIFSIPANTEICPVSMGGEAFALVRLV